LAAIRDVLAQLLRVFSIDVKNMTIPQMIQTLRSKGSILFLPDNFIRLETIEAKLVNQESLTIEEASLSIQIASKIIESSREVRVMS